MEFCATRSGHGIHDKLRGTRIKWISVKSSSAGSVYRNGRGKPTHGDRGKRERSTEDVPFDATGKSQIC